MFSFLRVAVIMVSLHSSKTLRQNVNNFFLCIFEALRAGQNPQYPRPVGSGGCVVGASCQSLPVLSVELLHCLSSDAPVVLQVSLPLQEGASWEHCAMVGGVYSAETLFCE